MEVGILFFPVGYQYDPNSYDPEHPWIRAGMTRKAWLTAETEIQNRLRQWTRERGVAFRDLTKRFRQEVQKGKRLNYDFDGHWNAAGHAVAADEIKNWIVVEDGMTFYSE